MKTLVTGGTGFIGSNLIERLRERGDEVLCIAKDALNAAALRALDVKVVLADLNNGIDWAPLLDGVERIFHLAGVTRSTSTSEYYRGNFSATRRFVEVVARHCPRLQRFVYLSSLAAVGPSPDGRPLLEDAPYHPVSHYGKSKMLGEQEVLRMRDRLPVTVLRPSIVYGPRERDMFDYMRIIRRGLQPLIGFRAKLFSIIHADDLVSGILAAGGHPRCEDEVYFLSGDRIASMREIGTCIARAVSRRPVRIHVPHGLVYLAAALTELVAAVSRRPVLFNFQKAREFVQPAWVCSVEKARAHFGFQPRVSLEEGMRKTFEWYCSHGWL